MRGAVLGGEWQISGPMGQGFVASKVPRCGQQYRLFKSLQRKALKHGQTPQDFLLEIERFIYLGVREYSLEVGDPGTLIRRVF